MKKEQVTKEVAEVNSTNCKQAGGGVSREGGSLQSKPLYPLQVIFVTHTILRKLS